VKGKVKIACKATHVSFVLFIIAHADSDSYVISTSQCTRGQCLTCALTLTKSVGGQLFAKKAKVIRPKVLL
jgi:ferredoxin